MSFHVGQKVVCVDDVYESRNWKFIPNRPVKNGIYHIRDIRESYYGIGFLLREIVNPPHPFGLWDHGGREGIFPSWRFRPLQERSTETGMSILRSLLNTRELVE